MKTYTTLEQTRILANCKTANELLEIKELLQELQDIDRVTQLVFDTRMKYLLSHNVIC